MQPQSVGLGETVTGQVDNPSRVERWTFTASAGQQVRFDLVNAAAAGLRFDLTGAGSFSGFNGLTGDSDVVSLPTAGQYVLTARLLSAPGGAYAFRLVPSNETALTFTGAGLTADTQVVLQRQGAVIASSQVRFDSPTQLTAVFPLVGLSAGGYDVVVSRPDGRRRDFLVGSPSSRAVMASCTPACHCPQWSVTMVWPR